MFERFTVDARDAVINAQSEARALGHRSVGTEHLLLGVLGVEHGTAARALAAVGLTPQRARDEVAAIAGQGNAYTHGSIPFEPRLRRTLDVAMQEAMSLGHDEVGTEHLAFALLAEREGIAGRVLEQVAERGVVRDALMEAMASPPEQDREGCRGRCPSMSQAASRSRSATTSTPSCGVRRPRRSPTTRRWSASTTSGAPWIPPDRRGERASDACASLRGWSGGC